MNTTLRRTVITFLILCPALFTLHSIAWADIFFWKTGFVAKLFGIPSTVFLWPLTLIHVEPGSPMNGPHFWLPMICVLLLAWSWLIQLMIQKKKKKDDRTRGAALEN